MRIFKIFFLIILLVVINSTYFFSIDESSDYSNVFASGGGIIPFFYEMKFNSAWAVIQRYDVDGETGEETFNSETEKLTGTPSELLNFGGGVNFILSYSYYYKFNASIGITFSLGYLVTPYYPGGRTILMINNIISSRILFLAKKGKPTNKVRFFYEVGLIGNFEIPYYPYGKSADYSRSENKYIFFIRTDDKILYKYTIYYPDFMFGVGPYFDIGLEINFKKMHMDICMFSWITLGSVFDDAYKNLESSDFISNPRYNVVITPIGFEIRLLYYKNN